MPWRKGFTDQPSVTSWTGSWDATGLDGIQPVLEGIDVTFQDVSDEHSWGIGIIPDGATESIAIFAGTEPSPSIASSSITYSWRGAMPFYIHDSLVWTILSATATDKFNLLLWGSLRNIGSPMI